jgi:nucleoid-associated protein YgaU
MDGRMTTESETQNSLMGRILAAAGVLLLGLLAALPFYRPGTPVPRPYQRGSAEDGARLILRNQDIILQVSSRVEESPAPSLPVPSANFASDKRTESPATESSRLPELPTQYRSLLDPNSTQPNGNFPLGRVVDVTPRPAFREHMIVNGDSLERLAERYLGSPARSREILELNRDLLRDGSLLPIGRVVKIPPRDLSSPVVNEADSVFGQR